MLNLIRFAACRGRLLVVLVCIAASSAPAGAIDAPAAARFWISNSAVQPISTLGSLGVVELDMLGARGTTTSELAATGEETTIYIWGQPARNADQTFKQLQNLSLNIFVDNANVDLDDVEIYNPPLVGNPTKKRFDAVRDRTFVDVNNPSLNLTTKSPNDILGTPPVNDGVSGLLAANLQVGVITPGVGIGYATTPDFSSPTLQAWRIASFSARSLAVSGFANLRLGLGSGGMNHAITMLNGTTIETIIEPSTATLVEFAQPGQTGAITYSAGPVGSVSNATTPPAPSGRNVLPTDAAEMKLNFSSELVGDYSSNGRVDGSDFLTWQRARGGTNSAADADHNGVVDAVDLTKWAANLGRSALGLTPAASQGDYNGDGKADGRDFLAWQSAFGSAANLAADGNGNYGIDLGDFGVWASNLGRLGIQQSASATQSVPEPQSLALVALAVACWRRRSRKFWQHATRKLCPRVASLDKRDHSHQFRANRWIIFLLAFTIAASFQSILHATLWWDRARNGQPIGSGNADWGDTYQQGGQNYAANWNISSGAGGQDPLLSTLNGNQFVFNNGSLNSTQNINLNANRNTGSLQFVSSGAVTINSGSGDNLLTIQGATIAGVPGTIGVLVDTDAGTANFTSRIRIGGSQDWRTRAGRTLNASGSIDLQSFNLNVTGDGSTSLSGQLFGAGSLTKSDGGTLTLSGATANAFSGSTTINGGTLVLDKTHSNFQAAITGNVFITAGGTLRLDEQGQLGDGFIQIVDGGKFDMASYDDTVGELIMNNGEIRGIAGSRLGRLGSEVRRRITSNGASTISTQAMFADGNVTMDVQSDTLTISAAIENFSTPGSITKNGGGTLVLTGANSYTGGVIVNGGLLQGTTASIRGPLSLAAGTANFNQGTTGDFNGVISGAGALTVTGGGRVNFTAASPSWSGGLAITASTVGGSAATLSTGAFTLNGALLEISSAGTLSNSITLQTNSAISTGHAVTLAGSITSGGGLDKQGGGTLTLTGANNYSGGTTVSSGVLVASPANLGTGSITINNASTLRFRDATTLSRSITLGAAGGVIDTNAFSPTISSTISGTGGLRKTGFGTLILSGSNSYQGNTVVDLGILQGNASNIKGSITLSNNAAVFFDQAVADVFGNVISGTGNIFKRGAGDLTLSADNTYTLGTVIQAGRLIASTDVKLGHSSGSITFGGGTLSVGPNFNSSRLIVLNAAATIEATGQSNTLSGNVSGNFGFTKGGAGTLILSGANTYTGATAVNGGTLQIGAGGTSGGLGAGNASIASGATLAFNRNDPWSTSYVYAGAITGPGAVVKDGTGIVELSGANGFTGNLTLANGALRVTHDNNMGGGKLVFNGGQLHTISGITAARPVEFGAGGGVIDTVGVNSTFSGAFTGAGVLIKTGPGQLSLTDAAKQTGAVVVDKGTLRVAAGWQANGTLNVGTAAGGDLVVDSGGALASTGEAVIGFAAGSTGSATVNGNSATMTVTSALTVGNSGTGSLTLSNGGKLINNNGFLGTTPGAQGTATVTGVGSSWSNSDLFVGGNISAAGGTGNLTVASGGGVTVANRTKLWNSSSSLTINGGTFATGSLESPAGGSPIIQLTNPSGGVALTVGSDNTDSTYRGTIANAAGGAGSLRKTGTGTLTLTGASTYTGGSTIGGGALSIDGSIAGNVTVESGGTLAGKGTIGGSVSGPGRVAPGNSPGILNVASYSQSFDSVLEIEVAKYSGTPGSPAWVPGTDHDQLRVTGAASLGGQLEIAILDPLKTAGGPATNLPAIDILTAGSVTGQFRSIVAPTLSASKGIEIEYHAGGARITFVPEKLDIEFDDVNNDNSPEWQELASWRNTLGGADAIPKPANDLTIRNNVATPQELMVEANLPALVARLTVGGGASPLQVTVGDGNVDATTETLSSLTSATVTTNGMLTLDRGELVASSANVSGGVLEGQGNVNLTSQSGMQVGTLIVAQGALSPGMSTGGNVVGAINIAGDYMQGSAGVLAVDLESSPNAGMFDTVNVTRNAELHGTLRIDVSQLPALAAGDTYTLLTAADGSGVFDDLEIVDLSGAAEGFYFTPFYGAPPSPSGEPAVVTSYSMGVQSSKMGDADGKNGVDERDAKVLAAVLINNAISSYRFSPDELIKPNFKDCFNFFTEGDPVVSGIRQRLVDFDDVKGFVAALSASQQINVTTAYSIFERAYNEALLQARVPEPGGVALAAIAMASLLSFGSRRTRRTTSSANSPTLGGATL